MTPPPHTLTNAEYERFRRLIDEKSGIDTPPSRRSNLEHVVRDAMARGGLSEPSALYRHLSSEDHRPDLEEFIAALTIGETHFFRNMPQFEALEQCILPDLIQRHARERRLRIWSAGCSSGEEPYSLAILLDRMLPQIELWNISILATDIDRHALKRAYRGVYRPWSFRGIPPEIESSYFTRREEELELAPRIRQMVNFEYLNLVDDPYPSLLTNTSAMDLIVCRNVLIYFRDETARAVIGRFHRSLSAGSWLLMGHAEPASWMTDRFVFHSFPGAVAYRKLDAAPAAKRPHFEHRSDGVHSRAPSSPRPRPGRSHEVSRHEAATHTATRHRPSGELDKAASLEERRRKALAARTGDAEDALSALETLAAEDPDDPWAPYAVAKIHAGRLALEKAEKWNDAALERDRLFAPSHYLRGLMAAEDARLDDAAAALRRCVYAAPDWPLGHFALAEILLRLGERRRAAGALRMVERLIDRVPAEDEVLEGEGLTAGRLLELTHMHKDIHHLDELLGDSS